MAMAMAESEKMQERLAKVLERIYVNNQDLLYAFHNDQDFTEDDRTKPGTQDRGLHPIVVWKS